MIEKLAAEKIEVETDNIMIVLPGYKVSSTIIAGVRTVIYRGLREKDQKPIVVKILKSEYPTLEEIARLRQEYTILENVACPGIVKPYSLEKYQNGYALILEDIGGQAMNLVRPEGKYPLTECLRIGIALAESLDELHKVPIIHKDIKQSNIIINEKTGEVRLTDFSIASRLGVTNATPGQLPEGDADLEGTLAYMSPEQTGRMNRSIDYRTDFYSLGVTLYEMLTGRRPFISTDPMELVHCHIAKQPAWLSEVNPEIPEAVAAVVMKLLAKRAEDRYQSGAGLKYDLERCRSRLLRVGALSDFIPGSRDRRAQLLIPQKLYGREAEVAALMNAFTWVSQEGEAEMMLVSGYSGIGKTAIVNEVHKPIVIARGYFIAGKYDQFKRNIPYSAVIQAFSELMSMLLTESSQRLAAWRTELEQALGPNGQVIVDVIPEVELIIGPQPEVPQLGPSEGQNRLNRVFLQFIGVFCKAEHPLVLFLDDLQWADAASLKLIELLMSDRDSKYILTIGAYRDNEVSPTHPLMQTIEKMQLTSTVVDNITIGPLSNGDVSQLVADTLFGQHGSKGDKGSAITSTEKIEALADLVFHKTGGNPFFLTQLLKSMYAENLLVYEVETDNWQWDMAEIQAVGITDYTVVELMAKNIQKLPAATQQVLTLAACIGNKFNLQVLAIANGSSTTTTAGQLWEALQAGLLLPLSEAYKIPLVFAEQEDSTVGDVKVDYKFLHDRVQQAAYSLIPEGSKKETHLKIGKQLLESTSREERKENIFALVNQLNHGVDLLTTVSEKDELAEMNIIAGQKAKAAAAYEASLNYINVGLGLLEEDSWQRNYDLMRALYLEAVEVEYLNSNFERSKVLAEVALDQAKTLLEKATVYELVLDADIAQSKMEAVIELAQEVLEMLGVTLEEEQPSIDTRKCEELADIPEMTDPKKMAAMRILRIAINAAYIANPKLMSMFVFTQVNLCIKYGNMAIAAIGYIYYGVILCELMEDLEKGYKVGQVPLMLLEKFNANSLKSIVLDMFNGHIRHWKEHVRETLEPLQEAVQSGLEIGELVYSGYAAINYCTHMLLIGEHLEDVEKKCKQYSELLTKLKLEYHVPGMQIYQQIVLNMLGKSPSAVELTGAAFKEAEMLPFLKENQILTLLFMVYMAKILLLYLFKQPGEAVKNAKLAEECISGVAGLQVVAQYNFYYSLALLAQHQHWEEREQKHALRKVASLQKQMHHWAEHAPCNFQHKYDLVEAERARVKGEHVKALELYEQAIKGAREQGYTHEEALANELAGEYHLARGHESMGKFYIIESYYGYIRWGGKAKVKDLESRYPQFLSRIATAQPEEIDVTRTRTATGGGSAAILDLPTVIKAGLAISSEMVLSDLMEKLMQIAMENAGAEKGILILNQNGKLVVSASAEVSGDDIIVHQSETVDMSQAVPIEAIDYVGRKKNNLILNEAHSDIRFSSDPYMIANQPLSVLCTSIVHQGKLVGILYLENNQTMGVFTQERLELLKLISSQAGISIENASLYANLAGAKAQLEDYARNLEVKVEERTLELQEKNQKLQQTLKNLKNTQSQLIQSEKMSSLGQMVAGVAHEINNPINFVNGNLAYVKEYSADILRLMALYQETYPQTTDEILSESEDMDLPFISKDLIKLLGSMQTGCDRIRDIVVSLRNFSRLDESDMKQVDLHSGINSTLMVLQHRLKAKEKRREIKVSTEYSQLPLVECYAGQLNQAFLNIISNAIDALEMGHEDESQMNIRIRTKPIEENKVGISIADNGPGMSAEVQSKMFDPFFTTKPVGSGTGMGLSICYQIVVERHRGELKCISQPGQGSEFIIEIPIAQPKKENNSEMEKKMIENTE